MRGPKGAIFGPGEADASSETVVPDFHPLKDIVLSRSMGYSLYFFHIKFRDLFSYKQRFFIAIYNAFLEF